MDAASDYAREVAEVDSAIDPMLKLPDGTEVNVGHISARRMIEYQRDVTLVMDEKTPALEKLEAESRMYERLSEDLGRDDLLDLDSADLAVVFWDFFLLRQRLTRQKVSSQIGRLSRGHRYEN